MFSLGQDSFFMGGLIWWSFSACLSEPAVKISSEALAPLFKPSCGRWAPLPALTQPASQSIFSRSAHPRHESELQQRQQQRAARGTAQEPASAADPEPAGAHLARVPREQERGRWAPLLGAAALQERTEWAHLRPNKPGANAKPERSQRDSLVIALQQTDRCGWDQPGEQWWFWSWWDCISSFIKVCNMYRWSYAVRYHERVRDYTGTQVELWITSHQKGHWARQSVPIREKNALSFSLIYIPA